MRAELPVFSFLSALSLLILVPFCLRTHDLPLVLLVAWLLLCNIIQGVNAIVWANNVSTHWLVWCDIVTPITLAIRVALPMTTVFICRQINPIPSSSNTFHNPRSKYVTPLFQCIMCILVPIVYMGLHIIVQSQRFTITEDFGCEASIYASIPAILIILPLPLLLCSITLFYAGISFYNYHGRCEFSSQHRQLRPKVTTVLFLRFMATSAIIAVSVAVVLVYDMISRLESGLNQWTSWIQVHSSLSNIGIMTGLTRSPEERMALVRTEVGWWLIPLLSIMSVVVIGSANEVIRINSSFLATLWNKLFRISDDVDILPIQDPFYEPSFPLSTAALEPISSNRNDNRRSSISPNLTLTRPQLQPIHIPVYGTSPVSGTDSAWSDVSFVNSTLSYLGSPTGRQALQQGGLVLPISPINTHTERSFPTPYSPTNSPSRKRESLTDGDSVFSLPWRQPPNTYPPLSPQRVLLTRDRPYHFISSPRSSRMPPSPFRTNGVTSAPIKSL